MTYREALDYLASVEGQGIKLALRNITAALGALGDPQGSFRSVLVAGTNGKGSVAAMLESILRAAGHRTGLYTSPHLTRYEERILVGGRPVAPEAFGAAVGRVRDATGRLLAAGVLEAQPTHFEILTAAAFDLLARAGVETAVLEVGMGGRLDATVLAGPVLSIITNVSLEHTRFLGSDIASIAREKAGVLPGGGTLLAAESHPDAVKAFRTRAEETGGRLVELDRWTRLAPGEAGDGSFEVITGHRAHRDLRAALPARYQRRNAWLAVAAADLLDAMGVAVPARAVREGLASARWPGRFQLLEGPPRLVLDGAHNPAACLALRESLNGAGFAPESTTLLVGILREKDAESMLRGILPAAGRVVTTRGLSPRFSDPWALAGAARPHAPAVEATASLGEGLARAREITPPGGAVCVTGSLYLVGDLMRELGMDPFAAPASAAAGSDA